MQLEFEGMGSRWLAAWSLGTMFAAKDGVKVVFISDTQCPSTADNLLIVDNEWSR